MGAECRARKPAWRGRHAAAPGCRLPPGCRPAAAWRRRRRLPRRPAARPCRWMVQARAAAAAPAPAQQWAPAAGRHPPPPGRPPAPPRPPRCTRLRGKWVCSRRARRQQAAAAGQHCHRQRRRKTSQAGSQAARQPGSQQLQPADHPGVLTVGQLAPLAEELGRAAGARLLRNHALHLQPGRLDAVHHLAVGGLRMVAGSSLR